MEEVVFTVKEAIEELGLSKTTIYAWMKAEKLEYKDTPRGRVIVLNSEKIEEIRQITGYYERDDNSKYSEEISAEFETVQNSSENSWSDGPRKEELSLQMLQTINNLHSQMLEYSEKAGQVKLLEDSERRTHQEYFKLIQENAELKAELKLKDAEILELKAKLEQNVKKTWWGKKVF